LKNDKDSLAKRASKGYRTSSAVGSAWSSRIRQKGRERGLAAGVGEGADGAPWPAAWRSPELGVWALPCMILEAEHTEREESEETTPRVFLARGGANAAVRGGAMPAASELAARALGSLKSHGKRTGRERR